MRQRNETHRYLKLELIVTDINYYLKALRDIYFSAEKDFGNVVKIRPSNEMQIIPTITSGFINHKFAWGDNDLMRWYCNNSKIIIISPMAKHDLWKRLPKAN